MPERTVPYAQLLVYADGAFGVTDDPGWSWYSPMCRDAALWSGDYAYPWGAQDTLTRLEAFRLLQLGERSVVIPTPRVYVFDSLLENWTATAGDWEERYLGASPAGYSCLYCLGTEGTLTSKFDLPAQGAFAVEVCPTTVRAPDVAHAAPPFLEITWGDEASVRYTLTLGVEGDLYLTADQSALGSDYATAVWGKAATGWKWPTGAGDRYAELALCIVPLCGGIAVFPSSNGYEPLFFQNPDGTELAPGSGPIEIAYRGGSMLVALHGVLGCSPITDGAGSDYGSPDSRTLTLTSPVVTTDRSRAAGPTCEGFYRVPDVTADAAPALYLTGENAADTVRGYAELTWGYSFARQDSSSLEGTQEAFPYAFAFGHFPELYAAQIRHDPIVSVPLSTSFERYSGSLQRVHITLADEAEPSSAEVEILWDTAEGGAWTDDLYCKLVTLAVGWRYDTGGADVLTPLLAGFVAKTASRQVSENRVQIQAQVTDVSAGARQVECDSTWPVLDGWNAAAAALYVAEKCGWPAARCDFSSCAGYTLSVGYPERPLWQATSGTGWSFLERILRYCLQEVALSGTGYLSARPIMAFNGGTIHTYPIGVALAAGVERPAMHTYTGVRVTGQDLWGNELVAWRADTLAESGYASGYGLYRGYRRLEPFEEAGFLTLAQCGALADALFACMGSRHGDVVPSEWVPFTEGLPARRDTVYLTGGKFGVIGSTRLGILSLEVEWGPRKPDCRFRCSCVGW